MSGVLLTSSEQTSAGICREIEAAGFDVFRAPMLEIVPVNTDTDVTLERYSGLVFTSANAVRVLRQRHPGRPKNMPVFAAGPQTAQCAREAGYTEIYQAEETGAGNIVRYLKLHPRMCGGKLLHVSGEDTAFPLAEELAGVGIDTDRYVIYRAVPVAYAPDDKKIAPLREGKISWAMFFSARAAENFTNIINSYGWQQSLKTINALCIGVRVLKSADTLPWAAAYAARKPDREGMLELLQSRAVHGPG